MKIADLVTEEQINYLNELIEAAAVRKKVVRKGKMIIKKDCPPGSKLVDGRKCVKIPAAQRAKMSRIAKKTAKKGKAKRMRTRKRSLRVRKARRL